MRPSRVRKQVLPSRLMASVRFCLTLLLPPDLRAQMLAAAFTPRRPARRSDRSRWPASRLRGKSHRRRDSLADIWANSPAFNAFRGTAWMQRPCANCARWEIDFGGCRCQAFALTGDARATDPVCHLAPRHEDVAALAAVQHDAPYAYRRM